VTFWARTDNRVRQRSKRQRTLGSREEEGEEEVAMEEREGVAIEEGDSDLQNKL
jgi:hypothetical protein